MGREWRSPPPAAPSIALRAAIGGHPLVAETLDRRGYADPDEALAFIDHQRYRLSSPSALPGVDAAVDRLVQAIAREESICVWGDFDVDGQTSTTVLVATLRSLGARVSHYIPVREVESHGVGLASLTRVIDGGARLVLTCDTGSTAHEAVALAKTRGVEFIVTDHHELPPTLPDAAVLVSPRLLPDGHPMSGLPGVGVAFVLSQALSEAAGRPEVAEENLDLVALGIVADLAWQRDDTRCLLQRGLQSLRQTARLGLLEMMGRAGLQPAGLSEEHISFVLAPRLNALGRLADANVAVEFLTTQDKGRAGILAAELEGLNARRKLLCDQVEGAAEAQLSADPVLAAHDALVLAGPGWPAGVVGIVASRFVERYGRPTLLISVGPDGVARGSARSVPGCNVTAAIAEQAEWLLGFGGHPMAAGLSLNAELIPRLRAGLSRSVRRMLGGAAPVPALEIDGVLPLDQITLELVDDLGRLAPFGPGNPPLTLVSEGVRIERERTLGSNREHRLVTVRDQGGVERQVIWWDGGLSPLPAGVFDLAYSLQASDFRGQRELQLVWLDSREQAGAATVEIAPRPAYQIYDWRGVGDAASRLSALPGSEARLVWREGEHVEKIAGVDRRQLGPARELAIWTSPPSPQILADALEQVQPEAVYLIAADPAGQPAEFLRRLAGLARHVLAKRGGEADLDELAATTAQPRETVVAGLRWLVAHGDVTAAETAPDAWRLAPGDGLRRSDLGACTTRLAGLLAETAAYRVHFAKAAGETLLRGAGPTPRGH